MRVQIFRPIRILFFLAVVALTVSCDQGPSNILQEASTTNKGSEFYVTDINNYEFLFNDTENGGVISFASNELKQCNLSFIKSKLIEGYVTRVTKLGEGDIDLTCLAENDHFSMDESGSTFTEIAFSKLEGKAVVKLSFSLVSDISKSTLIKGDVMLEINESQLKKLWVP